MSAYSKHAVATGAEEMKLVPSSPVVWSCTKTWLHFFPTGGRAMWLPATLTLYGSGLLVATGEGKRLLWAVRMLVPDRKAAIHFGTLKIQGVAELHGDYVGLQFHRNNVFVLGAAMGRARSLKLALQALSASGR